MRGLRAVVVVALGAAVACGPKGDLRHTVVPGDSLYRIGMTYGVDYREVARVNGLTNPNRLEVGQTLLIPDGTRPREDAVVASVPRRPRTPPADRRLAWPLEVGRVTSPYGDRNDAHHDGIDIAAPRGTPVRAAAAGRVIYSDRMRGYGNLVIVDHGDGVATVYAHNARNDVVVGERVRVGQVIATVGRTGRASTPHLHFEVREDNVARDPMAYLPGAHGLDRRAQRGAP